MSKLKRPQVITDLPKPVPEVIVFATKVKNAMDPNAYFTNLVPSTATFADDITALAAAEATAKHGGKGAADARDLKLKVVLDDVEARKHMVQAVCTANPAMAKAVATSAGMNTKDHVPYRKPTIRAVQTKTPGQVVVRA